MVVVVTFGISSASPSKPQSCCIPSPSKSQSLAIGAIVVVLVVVVEEVDVVVVVVGSNGTPPIIASKSEQQSLATTIGVQNSKQEINQKIKNIVQTSITNSVFNQVNGILTNLNKGLLEIFGKWDCGDKGGVMEINQGMVSEQIVELLSDAIISNIQMDF